MSMEFKIFIAKLSEIFSWLITQFTAITRSPALTWMETHAMIINVVNCDFRQEVMNKIY